ncbi:MAG: anthranilate synthase component I [Armatimonadetes bacterium]|nr:MAG: anthranilate synthase component I [Armatimonadota bacterium]
MRPNVSLDQFIELANRYPVVPVAIEVLGDMHTPVSVFDRLVGESDGFLLESVEGGERWGRWSFVGWDPAFTVSSIDGVSSVDDERIDLVDGDPLAVVEDLTNRFRIPSEAELNLAGPTPPLHTGAVGFLAYDVARYIEKLENRPTDDRDLPESLWQFAGGIAAFDRLRDTITLIRNVFVSGDAEDEYRTALASLTDAADRLSTSSATAVGARPQFTSVAPAVANMTRAEFETGVARAIEHIVAGDAFQIVPSIRFEVDFSGDAFAVYRALRLVNPSPFMFLVRSGDVSVVGSSPELMSRVRDGVVFSRPIAGTRPRGTTDEEDARLEAELLADPKERAEHVMLIDLARNDLGRVCEFGTVTVDDLMVIERYSHVMHIVSGVSGNLRAGLGPIDVLRATFPHGTVSGAPKVRAMEIIDELEPTARGPYAGAVGYVDFSGTLDTAIGLRTCVIKGNKAWVQAGAGVVVDSDPAAEYDECVAKASAVLTAIAAADNDLTVQS